MVAAAVILYVASLGLELTAVWLLVLDLRSARVDARRVLEAKTEDRKWIAQVNLLGLGEPSISIIEDDLKNLVGDTLALRQAIADSISGPLLRRRRGIVVAVAGAVVGTVANLLSLLH